MGTNPYQDPENQENLIEAYFHARQHPDVKKTTQQLYWLIAVMFAVGVFAFYMAAKDLDWSLLWDSSPPKIINNVKPRDEPKRAPWVAPSSYPVEEEDYTDPAT